MRARGTSLVLLLVVAMSLTARPANATWSRDPAANQFVSGSVIGTEVIPAMVSDGSGGVILAWFDTRSNYQNIYAQRIDAHGVPRWAAGGVVVCGALSHQSYPCIVSDGAGGAIVTWHDTRNGNFDIYAQRVNTAGVMQWALDGVAVCANPSNQYHLSSVSDGQGGVIATWLDERSGDGGDIYGQRMNGAGVRQWTLNGVAVCSAPGLQQIPLPVSDGAGGAIVTWTDGRSPGLSVYAQRVSGAGTVQWTANGVALASSAFEPTIAADGAGGAVIAWKDGRTGSGITYDIYAQRLNGAGVAQWFASGVGVCRQFSLQELPKVVSDGSGGAIITWLDYRASVIENYRDVYIQRVTAAGVPAWLGDGVALSAGVGQQTLPEITTDGAGGAIVAWQDDRLGAAYCDIYAGRVNASGVPQWTAGGMLVCSAAGNQFLPAIVADGRSGAVVAWYDPRGGVANDLYLQRIDGLGFVGDPAPELVSVADLPNDQGGHVRIKWKASFRDTFPTLGVSAYGVWRQVTAAAAASAARAGMRGAIREVATGAEVTWWEGVGSVLARGEATYTFVAETFQDSTATSHPNTVFMIDAHDATLPRFWSSVPDSGHSIDNLAPAPPAPFTGTYAAGAAHLDWGPNLENDLAGYRLYRGTTYGFVPGAGNRVASPTGTHVDDAAPSGSFYKLSAVDVHGNEGGFTPLALGTADAGGPSSPRDLVLEPARPNPARSGTTIGFALPRAGTVSLTVFDAGGREVRRLAEGDHAAGEYSVRWDLRDDRGLAVPGGLYWIRLSADGRELVRRMARIR